MAIYRVQWFTKTGKLACTYTQYKNKARKLAELMNGLYGLEISFRFPKS